ncbi:MAG: glycosyltransferase family 39 protein [Candidatus Sumerlaeota bacterium]|nr:glycosyltransferase family 39 protein [Candidatus Sumerlaeota bacterium]
MPFINPAPLSSPPSSPRRNWLWGLALAMVFILLQLPLLTRHGFWTDELHTYGASAMDVKAMLQNRFSAGHLPLFFLMLNGWGHAVGFTEWTLRLPSVVFAALALLMFFALARACFERKRTAWLATGMFFFSPFLLWAAREARMYSFLILVATAAAYFLLQYVFQRRTRFLALYFLTMLVGLNLHIILYFQVLAHIVFILFHWRRRLWPLLAASLLATTISFPMLLKISKTQDEKKAHRGLIFADPTRGLRRLSDMALGSASDYAPTPKPLQHASNVILFILMTSAIVYLVRRGRISAKRSRDGQPPTNKAHEKEILALRYGLCCIGVPWAALWLLAVVAFDRTGPARYYSPMLPPLILLLAVGFQSLGRRWWTWALMGAFALALATCLAIQMGSEGPGVRESMAALKEQYKPETDGVIYCNNGALRYAFPLYGAAAMKQIGISDELMDESEIMRMVDDFSKDNKRTWLLLYCTEDAPLRKLLGKFPDRYKPFYDETIRQVRLAGFEVLKPERK